MMTKEEYKDFYFKKGRTVDQIYGSVVNLNDRQLESKYRKYVKKEETKQSKNLYKIDYKWEELKKKINERDKNQCQLLNKLPLEEKQLIIELSNGLYRILDPAHRIGKGANLKLKYELSNVWTLNRYSHSMLDQLKSPITGKSITKEEHQYWWKIITGEEIYGKKNFKKFR